MSRKRGNVSIDSAPGNSSSDSEDELNDVESSEASCSDEESDHDIAAAEFDSEEEEDDVALLDWKRIPINKKIDFSRFPFTGKPGITIPIDENWTQLDYLKLYIDETIVNIVVTETNRYAENYVAKKFPSELQKEKYGWYPLTTDEFWVYFAILIYQAIIVKPRQRWYWTKNKLFATPFAGNLMSSKRFEEIMKFLHFSNNDDNASEHPHPKLRKIWEVYNHINSNFQKIYVPQRDISIDESLVPSKHNLSFQQFIPSKRARFGSKFYEMCESESGYIVKTILYTGKDTEKNNQNKNCGVTTAIVLELGEDLFHQGYCFIMDNFYNSPELYELLLSKRTDAYGTLKANRKGLPKEFSKIKLKKGESLCYQKDGMVVIKWHDKKVLSLISTCHDVSFIEVQSKFGPNKLKPSIVLDYNKTMGGVDRGDQQMGTYRLMRKQQQKYYKKLFRHLLEQCLFNAYVLYKKYKDNKCEHLSFFVQVIVNIIKTHSQNLCVKVKSSGRKRIERSLYGDTTPMRLIERHFPSILPPTEKKDAPTKRCKVCCSQKKSGKSLRKETRYYCKECDVPLCAAPCFEIYHTKEF